MTRPFRLTSVFRARQAQEDAAKAEVVRARTRTRAATKLARLYENELGETTMPAEGVAQAILASLAARRSLAAGLHTARQAVADAERHTAEKMAELAEAAKRRRAVELLAERHEEQVKREAQAADQRAVDELAVTGAQRTAAREVRS